MKKGILVAVMALLGFSVIKAQESVKWYSIDEAVKLSAESPRILVIDVFTDWCGWCKRMDATTFRDPEVVRMLNTQFYPVKLDAEGKEDITIADKTFKFVDTGNGRGYHEMAAVVTRGRLQYPTISYVDKQGRLIEASPGYKSAVEFRKYLAYISQEAYKTKTFKEFSESYLGDLVP